MSDSELTLRERSLILRYFWDPLTILAYRNLHGANFACATCNQLLQVLVGSLWQCYSIVELKFRRYALSDVLLRACPKNDRFAIWFSLYRTHVTVLPKFKQLQTFYSFTHLLTFWEYIPVFRAHFFIKILKRATFYYKNSTTDVFFHYIRDMIFPNWGNSDLKRRLIIN